MLSMTSGMPDGPGMDGDLGRRAVLACTRVNKPFPSKQALLSTAGGGGTALRTPKGKVYALGYFANSRSSSL